MDELAAPYCVFKDAAAQTDATRRFGVDPEALAELARTKKLRDVDAARFDEVFYPGGHGPLWDLAENAYSIALIKPMPATGTPVAAVCHAAGVLRHVKARDGTPMFNGRAVTGFANTEEQAVGLTRVVPFLLEDMLARSGGNYSRATDWQPHVVADGLLFTEQNPASSEPAAQALLNVVRAAATGMARGFPDADASAKLWNGVSRMVAQLSAMLCASAHAVACRGSGARGRQSPSRLAFCGTRASGALERVRSEYTCIASNSSLISGAKPWRCSRGLNSFSWK